MLLPRDIQQPKGKYIHGQHVPITLARKMETVNSHNPNKQTEDGTPGCPALRIGVVYTCTLHIMYMHVYRYICTSMSLICGCIKDYSSDVGRVYTHVAGTTKGMLIATHAH